MTNDKNRTFLMMGLFIFALFMTVTAGVAYAWFSNRTVDPDNGAVEISAANLGRIIFYNGDKIDAIVFPGWCETKVVRIESSEATVPNKYTMFLNVESNELAELGEEFGYVSVAVEFDEEESTVTSGVTGTLEQQNLIEETEKKILVKGIIAAGDVHVYNVTFCFPELDKNQNSQQGKEFSAYLSVEGINEATTNSELDVWAVELEYGNNENGLNCKDVQCALDLISLMLPQ